MPDDIQDVPEVSLSPLAIKLLRLTAWLDTVLNGGNAYQYLDKVFEVSEEDIKAAVQELEDKGCISLSKPH